MNRYKKEMKRKHDEARKNLSTDQIAAVDLEDAIKEKIEQLARKIHGERFSEEYDFTGDSWADAQDRRRGINPMSREYIEKIRKKREALGVPQLSDSGYHLTNDTYVICENEAKKQVYSDLNLKRPPAQTCVFCEKTIEEIGGKRISSQQVRGVALSEKPNGGNKDFPRQSFKLFDEVYLVIWGEKQKWTKSATEKAKNEYRNGKRPWFCQICGERKCSSCGSPINYPVGSDILYGNGCSSHVAIVPFNSGCININCENYKELDFGRS